MITHTFSAVLFFGLPQPCCLDVLNLKRCSQDQSWPQLHFPLIIQHLLFSSKDAGKTSSEALKRLGRSQNSLGREVLCRSGRSPAYTSFISHIRTLVFVPAPPEVCVRLHVCVCSSVPSTWRKTVTESIPMSYTARQSYATEN